MRPSGIACINDRMEVVDATHIRLDSEILDYIKWGESECRTRIRSSRGGGRLASETEAAKLREKYKEYFYGWYDLGGVPFASIFAVRQAWHKTRFIK